MKIKNETEIQLMKILFKTNGSKATKNITSKRAYPYGTENKYFRQLKLFFKPLTDYVNKYVNENLESLLRGDSTEIKLDAIPGDSFRNMIYNLEDWLSVYMPDIPEITDYRDYENRNNVILTSLGKTAEEAKSFGDKEFEKMLQKGIHVSVPSSAEWWNDMKKSWAEDNYSLITSNAKKYVSQINTLTEQAIVNGMSPSKLKEEIKKATEGLSDKHCKLLARDQMGKLNGQITEAQMQEIGLEMYVWSTSADDRVRDSHALMEGLLCRWDDASVCSYDNGKTWVERPSGAVDLHPGQDIQCRCVALSFYPELEAEMEGITLGEATEGLPDVQDLSQFNGKIEIDKLPDETLQFSEKEFNNYVNKNETEVWYRGYSANTKRELEEQIEQMLKGLARISEEETSATGKGLYFTKKINEAENYSKIRDKKYGEVITATLKKEAKIADHEQLNKLYSQKTREANDLSNKIWETNDVKVQKELNEKVKELRNMDIGTYAKSKGYDAIEAGFDEYVVLNQKMLIYKAK